MVFGVTLRINGRCQFAPTRPDAAPRLLVVYAPSASAVVQARPQSRVRGSTGNRPFTPWSNTYSDFFEACINAAEQVCELIDFWKARYTLRFVPVTMMSIIFTAGTTWVLVASEAQQSTEQRQQYLRNAGKCVNHLEHAERLWDSASQLRIMLARLLAEQQARISAAENPSGDAEAPGSGSISANSTRNATPAPAIASTSRADTEPQAPLSNPPASSSESGLPPPNQFHQEIHYSPRADPSYSSPQNDSPYSPQYHQSIRYTQATAQSASAAYMPNVWPPPTPQGSTSRMPPQQVQSGQNPYPYSTSSQLPTQPPLGPPDWTLDPRYWMGQVGDNIQLPGTNFYPPPPHGPPHGRGPY
jgi:hypothetical protein